MPKQQPVQRLVPLRSPGTPAGVSAEEPGPAPADPKVWISQEQAARQLHVGYATLKRLIADGIIYAIPVGASGTHFRVPLAEIEKWRKGTYGQQTGVRTPRARPDR